MKVFRTIMLFLSGKMNREKRDMPSYEESMKKTGKDSRWNRPEVKRSTVFVFLQEKRRIGLLFTKPVLMHWHMTLEEGNRDKYRLSLGGIAAPKENAQIQSERFKKPPDVLEEFLKNHPEIIEIEICTDNDFAGRWAKEQMKKHYEGTYQIICNLPEKEGADYADLAKEKKQANKCRDRPLERR